MYFFKSRDIFIDQWFVEYFCHKVFSVHELCFLNTCYHISFMIEMYNEMYRLQVYSLMRFNKCTWPSNHHHHPFKIQDTLLLWIAQWSVCTAIPLTWRRNAPSPCRAPQLCLLWLGVAKEQEHWCWFWWSSCSCRAQQPSFCLVTASAPASKKESVTIFLSFLSDAELFIPPKINKRTQWKLSLLEWLWSWLGGLQQRRPFSFHSLSSRPGCWELRRVRCWSTLALQRAALDSRRRQAPRNSVVFYFAYSFNHYQDFKL